MCDVKTLDDIFILRLNKELAKPFMDKTPLKEVIIKGDTLEQMRKRFEKTLTKQDKQRDIIMEFSFKEKVKPEDVPAIGWAIADEVMSKDSLVCFTAVHGEKNELLVELFD